MRQELPLSNGFYISDSLPVSHQVCTNWIPVINEIPSLSKEILLGTPGIVQITSSGITVDHINRGTWDLSGIPYFVNGTTLYRLDRSFVAGKEVFSLISLGTIEGTGRVSMADNGTQLMILVPGGKGYIYTEVSGLQEITDPDFKANGNPQYVVFIDGYFACTTDTKKWIISNLNDGLSWNALDVGSAESDPDPIVAPVVYNNQIYMLGSETTELFQNSPSGADFPFIRSNIFYDKGCVAPFSVISTNQRFFMLGAGKNETAAIWMFEGGQYKKISTSVIDSIINSYTDTALKNVFALALGYQGQYLVIFSFVDRTLAYNITTGLWQEFKSVTYNDDNDLELTRWRVSNIVTAYGHILVGDLEDGRIGKLRVDEYTEYGNNIIREFATQPFSNLGKSFRIPAIELTMEAGVGNSEVLDPVITMAISKDNKTFQYERARKIGAKGQYTRRTIWYKNGRIPRFATLKFRLSDPIKPTVIKLEADIVE